MDDDKSDKKNKKDKKDKKKDKKKGKDKKKAKINNIQTSLEMKKLATKTMKMMNSWQLNNVFTKTL